MDTFLVGAVSAMWLGILTSISPCPLATNISAISFVGKRVGRPGVVLLSGLCYTLGRVVAYLLLGVLVVAGLLSIPAVSNFLQKYMNQLLGPVLILAGMFVGGLIEFNFSGLAVSEHMQKWAETSGILGAGLLGTAFALSFCPVSAALFFGSLVPLSIKHNSSFVLPFLYGIGTGLPVVIFAILISMGAQHVGKAFNKLTRFEWWARRITAGVFILVGVYYSLSHIFRVF